MAAGGSRLSFSGSLGPCGHGLVLAAMARVQEDPCPKANGTAKEEKKQKDYDVKMKVKVKKKEQGKDLGGGGGAATAVVDSSVPGIVGGTPSKNAAKRHRRRARRAEAKKQLPKSLSGNSGIMSEHGAYDEWGEGRWIPHPSAYPALMEECKDADENAKLRHGFLSFIASPSAGNLTGAQVLTALEAKVLSRALAGAPSAGNQALSEAPVAAAEAIAAEQLVEKRARQ